MKRNLYLLALGLAILTAIGYSLGKDWEKEAEVVEAKESLVDQVKRWRKQAAQGDPDAQYKLGIFFEDHRQDYLRAQKWYRVAATKGQHAGAQYKLAQLYMNGLGVENNIAVAMDWFRQAAQKGDVRAQFFMGVAHRDGWARKADYIEAYKWFLLANRDAAKVRAENERYDPTRALKEMDRKMSRFNREEARKRAAQWQGR